jgi:hypothetical protein
MSDELLWLGIVLLIVGGIFSALSCLFFYKLKKFWVVCTLIACGATLAGYAIAGQLSGTSIAFLSSFIFLFFKVQNESEKDQ